MEITPAAARQRHGRDGVLEDQLFLRTGLQNHRVLVKALDSPRQLHPAHQVNRYVAAVFTGTVEKAVLYCVVLLRYFVQSSDSAVEKFLGYLKANTLNSSGARLYTAARRTCLTLRRPSLTK